MRVYLAEKKSQGHDLAEVLNGNKNYDDRKSYIVLRNQDVVTWCSGHLLTLAEPQYYDPRYKIWREADLPLFPHTWQWLPIERTKGQLHEIAKLLQHADEVVISSDFDREGQLLAVNVLKHCNYQGKALRIKLTATDHLSISRALEKIEDLDLTMPLYYSALARSHCDWLVGINLTRYFSCISHDQGSNEIVNIGRVITPTINLVVQRDEEIKNFKPQDYFEIEAQIAVQNGSFIAKWQPQESLCDSDGHCKDRLKAEAIFNKLKGKNLTIVSVDHTKTQEFPPLPFSQSKLQIYAARHFDLSPQETLDLCQALYDSRHKLTTYPRTDCQYLPESQLADAPKILENLAKDPKLSGIIAGCDLKRKSRAFSDKKMQGHPHNAIIPSLGEQKTAGLSPDEFKIYNIIRLFYIAQFYAPAEYAVLTIKATCEGENFIARGRTLIKPGFRVIFHKNELNELDSLEPQEQDQDNNFPKVGSGEKGFIQDLKFLAKKTRAPKHFDNASLIEAMSSVSKYIQDPELKKILKETNGLGTEPTRPVIINNMQKYGWIIERNKHFEATEKAIRIMQALPEDLKSAGMTALWESGLDEIANVNGDLESFESKICKWLESLIERCKNPVKRDEIAKLLVLNSKPLGQVFKCEKCGQTLKRLKSVHGYFFKCESCGQIYPDEKGKPQALYDPKTAPKCPYCQSPLKRLNGKKGHFFKCQNEACSATFDDQRGKPVLPYKCPKCEDFIIKYHGKYGDFYKCRKCGATFNDLLGKPLFKLPTCPKCGQTMRLITRKKTGESIEPFFSCPNCHATLDKTGKESSKKTR